MPFWFQRALRAAAVLPALARAAKAGPPAVRLVAHPEVRRAGPPVVRQAGRQAIRPAARLQTRQERASVAGRRLVEPREARPVVVSPQGAAAEREALGVALGAAAAW